MAEENIVIINENNEKPVGYSDVMTVYILYGISFIIGITWIAALIYAYIKRNDLKDTIYYSHMNYIIRTCWWTILWVVVGAVTLMFIVGFIILFIVSVWAIYRGVKGYITFKDGKAI